jgi:hypothetical protein
LNHPDLLQEKRKRMKILFIDPHKNIPVKKIDEILKLLTLGFTPQSKVGGRGERLGD